MENVMPIEGGGSTGRFRGAGGGGGKGGSEFRHSSNKKSVSCIGLRTSPILFTGGTIKRFVPGGSHTKLNPLAKPCKKSMVCADYAEDGHK